MSQTEHPFRHPNGAIDRAAALRAGRRARSAAAHHALAVLGRLVARALTTIGRLERDSHIRPTGPSPR